MTRGPRLVRFAASICISLLGLTLPTTKAQDASRKVVTKVEPEYPSILKERHIGGVVKLQALVRADGVVKDVVLLGGNPSLGDAAIKAVKQWRYAPSARETTEEVTVHFNPR